MRALQELHPAQDARRRRTRDLAWLLVLDSLIFDAEAEVRWLDHCEARLAPPPRADAAEPPQRARTPSSTVDAARTGECTR